MTLQSRSPTRKPVVNTPPINYSQPSRKPVTRQEEASLAQETSRLYIDEDDEEDDFGIVGASAERSPGRIIGRNRDTAMFDPMAKRGTYMPYGGFDALIDTYYTEGDPSELSIPAPSQLQKREQSRSPQRQALPLAKQSDSVTSAQLENTQRDADARLKPQIHRQGSGASAQSSQAGSMHSSSPNRSRVVGPRQEGGRTGYQAPYPDQYYDDDYYAPDSAQPQTAPYPEDVVPRQQPPMGAPYDGRQYVDRRGPSNPATEQQQRGRYGESPAAPSHSNGPPRSQREPLRAQRSMDLAANGRQPMKQNYGNGPTHDARAGRGQEGRNPRAIQQDPRLAPRSMSQEPRYRQGPMPRGQFRPPEPHPAGQQTGQYGRPDDRQYDPRMQNRSMRGGRDERTGPYPPNSSDGMYQQPQNYGPPGMDRRHPDVRSQEPFQQPADLARDPRMGRPPPPPPQQQQQQQQQQQYPPQPPAEMTARNGMQRQPVQQSQSQYSQRPQQGTQQQVQSQPPAQNPPQNSAKGAPAARQRDSSDMVPQSEPVQPVQPVTLAEIQALKKEISKNNSPQLQLTLVKKLMEISPSAASDGGKTDPKQAKKNKDDYNREALRTLKQITAQEKPFPEALFFLASCYGSGALALEVDEKRAFALYEQAAKLQHPASAYRTAVCLEIGEGTREDVERSVRFYQRAAEYGDTAAMYKIGMILLRGLLQERPDPKQALMWLHKAAEQADAENPHALHELALLYENGDAGVVQDEARAKELFTKAAKLHYAPSQFRLGQAYEYGTLGCPVNPRSSIGWFSRGAARGDPESELSLSGWYLTGSDGILAQNDREAYLWGRKAAEKGLAKAEFAVGYFFESGIGTNVDLDEAIKWYKRAATAGQKKAQERLLALSKRKR